MSRMSAEGLLRPQLIRSRQPSSVHSATVLPLVAWLPCLMSALCSACRQVVMSVSKRCLVLAFYYE